MEKEKVLWPGWETVRLIGRGSFGAVYEIERDVFGHKEKAALKVITIPQSDSDIEELYDSGYDEASVTATFKSHLESIVNEYSLMREMNGAANVVNCDDFRIVPHDDNIGWDIFIKMELLTPLTKALGKQPSDEQVIQIAKDMCEALILCKKYGIIHRDIKPQNIFVSKNGDYKLGDFGIAKTIEKTSGGTKIGTYKYMAPEVYNNQPYNMTADIYSLGLVLHWMLNERRSPFMPLPPAPAVASQEDEARAKRFNGTPIPVPAHGSEELKRIVLKACAYDSKDRFQSAEEMLSALQRLGESKWMPSEAVSDAHAQQEEQISENDGTVGAWGDNSGSPITSADNNQDDETVGAFDRGHNSVDQEKPIETITLPPKPKKKNGLVWGVLGGIALIAVVLFIVLNNRGASVPAPTESQSSETTSPTVETTNDSSPIISHRQFADALSLAQSFRKKTVAAGDSFAVGVKADGSCVTAGTNAPNVSGWRNIVAITGDSYNVAGIQSDGRVVCTDRNLDVSQWTDMVQIEYRQQVLGEYRHIVGLTSNGTVVATGTNNYGECDVSEWYNIVDVSAGYSHTVGLRSDGTVVACGNNEDGQCNVSEWENIIDVAASRWATYGLTTDGRILVVGSHVDTYGNNEVPDVPQWENVVAIIASNETGSTNDFVLGVCADGSLVSNRVGYLDSGDIESFSSVRSVAVSSWGYTICVDSHGNVHDVGWDVDGDRIVDSWPALAVADAEQLSSGSSSFEIGDVVLFGSIEQDNDLSNGAEEIEWIVLDKSNGKALLISKYILFFRPYNDTEEVVEWENCSLRKWLNDNFINSAFTASERTMIASTTFSGKVDALDEAASATTTDFIFILSRDELREIYNLPDWNGGVDSDYVSLVTYATQYAAKEAGYGNNTGPFAWWERCKAGSAMIGYFCAANGRTHSSGGSVDSVYGVRPAIWVTISE